MQLSKIELISASLGILVLFITGAGYIMVLNNEVNDLKATQDKRDASFEKLTLTLEKKIKEIDKEKESLSDLKEKLEKKYNTKQELLISNLIDEAKDEIALGDYNSALIKLKKVTEDNPSSQSYMLLARAYRLKNKNRSALTAIKKAMEGNEKNVEYIKEHGYILSGNNNHKDAIYYFNRALEHEPKNTSIIVHIANNYSGLGDNKTALEYIDIALSINKDFTWAYYSRGSIYLNMGNNVLAEEDFKKVLDIENNQQQKPYTESTKYLLSKIEK